MFNSHKTIVVGLISTKPESMSAMVLPILMDVHIW